MRGVEHRIALDLEQEQGALADEFAGQREDVFDRLLGQDRPTGGDAARAPGRTPGRPGATGPPPRLR
jgi:hypothetical protein